MKNASQRRVFVVFIVLDHPSTESIFEMKEVSFVNGAVNVVSYMDHFPFPYYIVLHDLKLLPTVLAEALRQWFEMDQSD